MEADKIHVHQCALIITLRCTLKCKMCLVYSPYYSSPEDFSLSEIKKTVDAYFQLVDSCDTFNIQGGEPLVHRDISEVVSKVAKYKDRIGKILLTTNGTLLPSENLLYVLNKYANCIQVNISDYGPSLSRKVPQLVDILEQHKIPYHVINYHGSNLHFGGWLDFTDHTLKHKDESSLIANAEECGYRNGGNLAIRNGELFFCYRVARRIELGIIKKDEMSCVNMFDDRTVEEKRQNIRNILNVKYTPACAYCVGKRSKAVHYPPAIQLSPEELKNGVEKL